MISLLPQSVARLALAIRQVLVPHRFPGARAYLRRLVLIALCLPAFVLLQSLHWACLLLDELLFRGYRRIEVDAPVFVLGVPRSGTTFIHRLLAVDPQFTTLSAWECLLAPSITERYLYRGLARLYGRAGRPFDRLMSRISQRVFRQVAAAHPMSLDAPEEDYLVLMPLLACFVLVVILPEARWLWRLARFDECAGPLERRQTLDWYHRCLQRHLYFHGGGSTLLSKNAAFAGMAGSLAARYPDSRLIVCERDATQVVRSQFRSLASLRRVLGNPADEPLYRSRLLDTLASWYATLDRLCDSVPDRTVRVPLWRSSGAPATELRRIYRLLERPLPISVAAAAERYTTGRHATHGGAGTAAHTASDTDARADACADACADARADARADADACADACADASPDPSLDPRFQRWRQPEGTLV